MKVTTIEPSAFLSSRKLSLSTIFQGSLSKVSGFIFRDIVEYVWLYVNDEDDYLDETEENEIMKEIDNQSISYEL